MNKIKMIEHFQGTGVPVLSVGEELSIGSGGISLELAKWLVDNGKAQDISKPEKPKPELKVEKEPEPEPEKKPESLGVMTSDKVFSADKVGRKGKSK